MIFGTGIDIIEVGRIHKQLTENQGFRNKLFTEKEIEYCESKNNFAQHYAARFAAKEALFKSIGTGWRGGFAFTEIEIRNDELGKPEVVCYGKTKDFFDKLNIKSIHVTLSHLKDLAIAFVIVEK